MSWLRQRRTHYAWKKLASLEEVLHGYFQRMSDSSDVAKGGVPEPEFDAAEVGPMDPGLFGEFLLRHALSVPQLADAYREIPNRRSSKRKPYH